jgi:hypothetical protein
VRSEWASGGPALPGRCLGCAATRRTGREDAGDLAHRGKGLDGAAMAHGGFGDGAVTLAAQDAAPTPRGPSRPAHEVKGAAGDVGDGSRRRGKQGRLLRGLPLKKNVTGWGCGQGACPFYRRARRGGRMIGRVSVCWC